MKTLNAKSKLFRACPVVVLRWSSALAFVAVVGLLVAGCKSPESSGPGDPSPPSDPGTANYATNLLHEGDVVSISFQYTTNLSTVQKITLDGNLNLESAGAVKAAGKTTTELEEDLTKLYKSQIQGDTVTVKLVSAVASVYVSGAVFRPGKIEMERPLTALEAVMEAGGFDPTRAKMSDATVIRIENGKERAYHVNLQDALDGRTEATFYLKPFDIVHIPSKTFNF